MPELLVELFSEEIPARMQSKAANDFARTVTAKLGSKDLTFKELKTYVTPRRLTLVVSGLPEVQPDICEEKRGPKVEAPKRAIQGFLDTNGVTRGQCEERETVRGTFLFAKIRKTGRPTRSVLAEVLGETISTFPWRKSMRWGNGELRWVRSLQRILCLFDGQTVDITTKNNVPSDNLTSGHRFLKPDTFPVSNFDDYKDKLRSAKVILDPEERKNIIVSAAQKVADESGLALYSDPGLLDEVAGLVEWPQVLTGMIDETFLELPQEVLMTSMRSHQKYFSLVTMEGSLAPKFIVVANVEAKDGGLKIIAGNERVLRARLSDAKFFWEQDLKVTLDTRLDALADTIFHAKLGTMLQKVKRLEALSGQLAKVIPGCDPELAKRAALLCKADLMTEMVSEFPELQGEMGRQYSMKSGEDPRVANAIGEHYSPVGPNDSCSTSPLTVAVALADKLYTLVGFFSVQEVPTGSRDPYALRRAALGLIRLTLENHLRLPLLETFRCALHGYEKTVVHFKKASDDPKIISSIEENLLHFVLDRLKVHLREKGVRHDHVSAVFARSNDDDLVRLLSRVEALSGFLATEDGDNLFAAYRRATNIVTIEEKKDGNSYNGKVDTGTLTEAEDVTLIKELSNTAQVVKRALKNEKYVDAMTGMSRLRVPVDQFFENVTVNTDDKLIRANRLRLLSQFRQTLGDIADFSEIEGS
ncbi:MAG: glycine--tRNA ligase subunit beta [Pseudomonadota bacterium]|nr:glycine--tRNA ligase subunit beta [Pseudomonadota bacterium]